MEHALRTGPAYAIKISMALIVTSSSTAPVEGCGGAAFVVAMMASRETTARLMSAKTVGSSTTRANQWKFVRDKAYAIQRGVVCARRALDEIAR